MKTKIIILILTLSLFLNNSSFSSPTSGRGGDEFIKKTQSPRYLAMGGTSVALYSDATAPITNPASLYLAQREVMFSNNNIFGVNYNYLGYIQKNYGISILAALSDPIESYDANRNYLGIFRYDALGVVLGYGKNVDERTSLGVNFKYFRESMLDVTGTGYCLDLGGLYKANKDLTFGFLVQNFLQSKINWNASRQVAGSVGAEDEIPLNLKLGLSYKLPNISKLLVAIEYEQQDRRVGKYHFGAEYSLNKNIAIRGGYSEGNFSAGLGMNLDKYTLDYSFDKHELQDASRVSLRVRF